MLKYGNADQSLAGAGCYTCRSAGPLVSTEISIEGEGILAFCHGCITDMARAADLVIGLKNVAETDALVQENVDLIRGSIVLQGRVDQLTSTLNTLREQWVAAVETKAALLDAAAS